MITGVASLLFVALLAVVFAHLMWTFGSTWPVRDRATLVRTVIGRANATKMPSRPLTLLVALLIFGAGLWALAMTDPAPSMILTLGGVVLAITFLARGIAGYLPVWRALTPVEPFASLDRKFYSPLCLFLGIGFAILTFWRLF